MMPIRGNKALSAIADSRYCRALLAAVSIVLVALSGATPSLAQSPSASLPSSINAWQDEVVYFVLIDRFADGDTKNNVRVERRNPGGFHGGDLRGLSDQLDEIASLGATAIWINPIQKQVDLCPYAQAPRNLGIPEFQHCGFHGYWMADFQQIDKRFGTMDDLRHLVKTAHQKGIKILLDVVYNHTGYGGGEYAERKTTTGEAWLRTVEGNCEVNPITCKVGGLPDFKTELPEVRDYILAANINLARESGIDGFRLDTYKHLDSDFWRLHRQQTRAINPHFFLLAEQWGATADSMKPVFERDEVDAAFDFSFKGSCEAFAQGRGRPIAFASYLSKRHRVPAGHSMVHYLSSHDEPMALANLNGDKALFRLCVAVQLAIPGIPMIYYGEEVGRQGSVWPTNRNDMPWGDRNIMPGKGIARDEDLRQFYQERLTLRKAVNAMRRGEVLSLTERDGAMLVLAIKDPDKPQSPILLVINREDSAQTWSPNEGFGQEALGGVITQGVPIETIAQLPTPKGVEPLSINARKINPVVVPPKTALFYALRLN